MTAPTPAGDAEKRCYVEVAIYSNRFPHYDRCERRAKHHVTVVETRWNRETRQQEPFRTIETHLCTQHHKMIEAGRSVPVIVGLSPRDGKYHVSRFETASVHAIQQKVPDDAPDA